MTATAELDQYLTTADVARLLRLSLWTVRGMLRRGLLPRVRLGKSYLVPRRPLAELLRRRAKAEGGR
jgi:excisionase family DNA binding protein